MTDTGPDKIQTTKLVPKPSIENQIKEQVAKILRKLLTESEAGQIAAMLVICKRPDGSWYDECTSVMHFPDAIGRLEIVKHDWITQFLKDDTI